MTIDITKPDQLENALVPRDPDARARYLEAREYKLRIQAREENAREFVKLVRAGKAKQAGELLLASSPYEHLGMLQQLDGDEVPPFCKGSSQKVVDAVIVAHPNPHWLRRQLMADDDVVRWTRVIPSIDIRCSPVEITTAQAKKLTGVGAGHLVMPPTLQGAAPRFIGLSVAAGMSMMYRTATLNVILEVDTELRGAVDDGLVRLEPCTLDECRAIGSMSSAAA